MGHPDRARGEPTHFSCLEARRGLGSPPRAAPKAECRSLSLSLSLSLSCAPGKSGQTVKEIEAKSGAKISIQRTGEVAEGAETRRVTVQAGTEEAVVAAREMVEEKLRHEDEMRGRRGGGGGGGGDGRRGEYGDGGGPVVASFRVRVGCAPRPRRHARAEVSG